MLYDVTFPKLTAKTEKGMLVSWLKNVGDFIEKDEVLYEVETDKAVHEIECPYSGIVTKHYQPEGTVLYLNDLVAQIEEASL
ncbi:biotin/lipoyl-containing protein [Vagococcus humatus]|uniref:Lipoyl-binding domain-containing protein n=1 Tax=Vagococcus humatus TaxID=1889241 RepID=A0A429Z587_9ENTE|nr:biotin/lipoyl-containing protein [Vagococcus humatus]RST88856.1 hypothetical protein C7P63_08525 [Vagococcus humatus]